MLISRKQSALALAALSTALLAAPCLAQSGAPYPNKPVRIVSPFAPGGGSDLMARTLALELGRDLAGGTGAIRGEKPLRAQRHGAHRQLPETVRRNYTAGHHAMG